MKDGAIKPAARKRRTKPRSRRRPLSRPWTMPVVAFGERYYGLSRAATYRAAKRGDIPVKRVGRRVLGLPHKAEAELGHDPA
jgi:hypothetical protein